MNVDDNPEPIGCAEVIASYLRRTVPASRGHLDRAVGSWSWGTIRV